LSTGAVRVVSVTVGAAYASTTNAGAVSVVIPTNAPGSGAGGLSNIVVNGTTGSVAAGVANVTIPVGNGWLYVSADYGSTWTTKMSDACRNWRRVAMSTNGQYQTAVCEMKEDGDTGDRYGGGIYVSSDYGATWTLKVTDIDWSGVAVCGNGARQTACGNGSQMYVSTDYGATWVSTDVARDWRCVSSSADGTVQFAIVADNGIYKSTDYGTTWNQAGPTQWWEYVTSSPGGSCHIAVVLGGGLWVAR